MNSPQQYNGYKLLSDETSKNEVSNSPLE